MKFIHSNIFSPLKTHQASHSILAFCQNNITNCCSNCFLIEQKAPESCTLNKTFPDKPQQYQNLHCLLTVPVEERSQFVKYLTGHNDLDTLAVLEQIELALKRRGPS